jgi:hypothetical protein
MAPPILAMELDAGERFASRSCRFILLHHLDIRLGVPGSGWRLSRESLAPTANLIPAAQQ